MEETEILSSAASDTDGFSQTENDDSLSETCSETLNLVEDAILRTLREHSLQSNSKNAKTGIETRLRGGFRSSESEENYSAVSRNVPPARSSIYEDRALLANLLEQVHGLRRNETPGSRRSPALPIEVESVPELARGGSFDRRRSRGKKPSSSTSEQLKMTLDAAAIAAKAAADAAAATAVSVTKNTEAMELLVNSMKRFPQKRRKSRTNIQGNVVSQKAIDKRNRILQWTLGFMVAITVAWRFGAVKATKRVADKLNEPIGYVGGLSGSGDESSKEEEKEKPVEDSPEKPMLEKLQQIELPSILLDSDHKTNDKEKSDHLKPAPDPEKKQEVKTFFSFGKFFQRKSTEN